MIAETEIAPTVFPDNTDFADNVFVPHREDIRIYLQKLIGSEEVAEDLTQETFLKAYYKLEEVRARGNLKLKSWLYTIATNLAKDLIRRKQILRIDSIDEQTFEDKEHQYKAAFSEPSRYDSPEQHLLLREQQDEVHAAFTNFPLRNKVALLEFEGEGFSCAEIAEHLGCTPQAVKSMLPRVRSRFRVTYEKRLNDKQ